jgi:hypothetical protein
MSLSVNSAADVVTEYSRFIGISEIKVQTVNPTKAEIKALFGRDVEKEPNYWDAEKKQRMVVFYYETKEFITDSSGTPVEKTVYGTHTIWMKDGAQMSKDGKSAVYIDNFGNSIYMTEAISKAIPEKWKIKAPVRVAYNGEADLVDFMKALCVPAREQEFFIPNVVNIINNGDVSVLRQAILSANNEGNLVRALMGVRKKETNTYQVLFNKWFDFKGTSNLKWLWKQLKDNKDYIKHYFGNFDFSKDDPNPEWFRLKLYVDGMENGNFAASAIASVPSFSNMFGNNVPAPAQQLPSSMAQPTAPQQFAQPQTMMPSTTTADILGSDEDDLPF